MYSYGWKAPLPFEDEDLQVALKSDDSDSDGDTVISAIERTIVGP